MKQYHYVSFAGDDGFIGGAIIEGDTEYAIRCRSTELGLFPDGDPGAWVAQALGPFGAEHIPDGHPIEKMMTRAELEEFGGLARMPESMT
jgi:hypothetical protein